MLGIQEVNREDKSAAAGVFFIEVRFVIDFWRPFGIGYDDELPLLSPPVSRVEPPVESVTDLESDL